MFLNILVVFYKPFWKVQLLTKLHQLSFFSKQFVSFLILQKTKINNRKKGQEKKNENFFDIIIQTILKRLAANKIAAAVRIFKTICIYFNTTKNKDK